MHSLPLGGTNRRCVYATDDHDSVDKCEFYALLNAFISAITHTRKSTLETIHRQPLDQSLTDKRVNSTAEKLKGKGIPALWSPVAHQGAFGLPILAHTQQRIYRVFPALFTCHLSL